MTEPTDRRLTGHQPTGETLSARPLTAGAAAPSGEELFHLRQVAAGQHVADVAIRGGQVIHVHTGEIRAADVIIHGRHIAAVVAPGRLQARRTVNATGQFVAPTFIDSHFHPEYSMLVPGEIARLIVPRGTTTVLADANCSANVLGARGMDLMAATTTPLRMFAQVTPDVPRRGRPGLNGAAVPQQEILERITRSNAVSLGESNPFLLDREMAEALSVTLHAGKRATGHTARLADEALWAYAAGGVGDDHNAATLEEVIDRLRLGMIVTLQSGSMTDYCAAILGRPELLGLVASHIAFCADDKHVEDLADEGSIDHHVRSAVSLGVDPAIAVRMASLNSASHFRIDHLIGSLTPSRLADLQLLDNLTEFRPRSVWVDGIEVARDGRALFANSDTIAPEMFDTVKLGAAPRIEVRVAGTRSTAWVQAMEMYDGYYKRAFHVELDVADGIVQADPASDISKICIVDRHHASGRAGIGYVRGFGLTHGAVAASTNCDNQNVVVVGTSDAEIQHALQVMGQIGGGYVTVADGEVLATVALPVEGLMSDQPWEVVYEQSRAVNAAAAGLGCRIHAPFMILSFVGLNGVPDLGLNEVGLIDVASQMEIPVVLELDNGRPVCRCSAVAVGRAPVSGV
ncbi:MAG: adenine deaminase C-terminal domain-containing protein [Ilumatobacteraceae bacterium]